MHYLVKKLLALCEAEYRRNGLDNEYKVALIRLISALKKVAKFH